MDPNFITPANREGFDKESLVPVPKRLYGEELLDFICILKDYNRRNVEERMVPGTLPFQPFTGPVVELFLSLCCEFRLPPEVKYMALEIFDRFTALHYVDLNNYVQSSSSNPDTQLKHWHSISSRAKKQALLRVLSSIQIASKFVLQSSALTLQHVQQYLTKCGHTYSLRSLGKSERRIFSMLDCQVPRHTVYDTLTALLEVINHWTDRDLLSTCEKILIFTFLQRDEIYMRFFWLTTSRWERSRQERLQYARVELDSFLMASAVIVSSMYILNLKDIDPDRCCKLLCDVGCVSSNDVKGLGIIITQTLLGERAIDFSSLAAKN